VLSEKLAAWAKAAPNRTVVHSGRSDGHLCDCFENGARVVRGVGETPEAARRAPATSFGCWHWNRWRRRPTGVRRGRSDEATRPHRARLTLRSASPGCSAPTRHASVPGPLLYSTNVWLKLHIQQTYQGDKHHVWCSELFDGTKAPGYSAPVPPSSDPCAIYRQLHGTFVNSDRHCPKIKEQKASFCKLATRWEKAGEITAKDKADILFMTKHASAKELRPLVYVIPRAPVESRLKIVPIKDRAGLAMEYRLEGDLLRTEFDVIEL